MSLLGEDMQVTRHVYSTGTGSGQGENAAERRADPAFASHDACTPAQVITPCAMVNALRSPASQQRDMAAYRIQVADGRSLN